MHNQCGAVCIQKRCPKLTQTLKTATYVYQLISTACIQSQAAKPPVTMLKNYPGFRLAARERRLCNQTKGFILLGRNLPDLNGRALRVNIPQDDS